LAAERAVLGAMLISRTNVETALELLDENEFQVMAHRKIFHSMRALWASGQAVDVVTVIEVLRRLRQLREVGGPGAITDLIHIATEDSPIKYYAQVIKGHG
jgi:replicative DNA helicase